MDSQASLPPEYLRTPEAASYLSLSPQFLEVCRQRREGPPYVKVGRAIRYRRTALDDWMKTQETLRRPIGLTAANNALHRDKTLPETSH